MKAETIPRNVYAPKPTPLPEVALDRNTYEVGRYLIDKFVFESSFHESQEDEKPSIDSSSKAKVQTMKGLTVRRMNWKSRVPTEEKQLKEIKRKRKVKSLLGIAESLSSEMKCCQAVVKPDCSKSAVQKSTGMKKALVHQFEKLLLQDHQDGGTTTEDILKEEKLLQSGMKDFPVGLLSNVSVAIVEFAGQKFKTRARSGQEYLKMVEDNIKKILRHIPSTKHIVICEEKYKFTPDDFKASTRVNRTKSQIQSISHLKRGEEIISSSVFDKKAVVGTEEGKSLISCFLAKYV